MNMKDDLILLCPFPAIIGTRIRNGILVNIRIMIMNINVNDITSIITVNNNSITTPSIRIRIY